LWCRCIIALLCRCRVDVVSSIVVTSSIVVASSIVVVLLLSRTGEPWHQLEWYGSQWGLWGAHTRWQCMYPACDSRLLVIVKGLGGGWVLSTWLCPCACMASVLRKAGKHAGMLTYPPASPPHLHGEGLGSHPECIVGAWCRKHVHGGSTQLHGVHVSLSLPRGWVLSTWLCACMASVSRSASQQGSTRAVSAPRCCTGFPLVPRRCGEGKGVGSMAASSNVSPTRLV